MSGHTEGPLVVKRAENPSDGAYDYAIIAKVNGEDQIIGETFGRSDWSVYLPAEENANLFAAAPTLLAERDEARREVIYLRSALKAFMTTAEIDRLLAAAQSSKEGGE